MRGLVALCVFSLAAAGCGSIGGTAIDCYSVDRYKKLTQPSLDLYVMNVKSEKGSRIDLYGRMEYHRLHFIKTYDAYVASYYVLFLFSDKNGEPVQSTEVERNVRAETYEASVSATAEPIPPIT